MTRKPKPAGECPIDKYQDWIEHLANASEERIVLVQHKSDSEVLKSLGVKNVFFYREPEFDCLQEIIDSGRECILLFDVSRPDWRE